MKTLTMTAAFCAVFSVAANASPNCTDRPKSEWMTEAKMKGIIESLGYKVKTFEITGSCYEIYGKDKSGERAEVYFNPLNGGIVQKDD
ncbi:PepSY domain-containing protein [Aestuariivirga sp.]|uniref:PepSY domain-containing protein n=1 Tax=Aestuariivirga sp. TaxID=2650926 RepID=UPI0039E28DFA